MDGIADEFLPKFDRSKAHGIVTPPEQGAHFEQDGFYFTQEGELVEALMSPADKARVKNVALQREAARRAEDARLAFLAENGIAADDPDREKKVIEAARTIAESGGGVDLVAWAKGEKAYPFAKVRKAAEEKYSFTATDTRSLVEFMIDAKKIAEGEVKVRGA